MHVTVLMAVHNGAGTVSAAVQSILAQTYSNWELLIVDDGSSDDTPLILQSFAEQDERIHVISNSTNRGLPSSLNIGWKRSRSKLIARMDADDFSFPERLQRQVQFMNAHPEVAVLGTGAELIDEEGKSLGRATRPEQHEQLVAEILSNTPFIHPSVMVRREFYQTLGGYDERFRQGQDRDLWIRGRHQFRFHNLAEPLIRYRVRHRIRMGTILWGSYLLYHAVRRERMPLMKLQYPLKFFVASMLAKIGLWNSRLR